MCVCVCVCLCVSVCLSVSVPMCVCLCVCVFVRECARLDVLMQLMFYAVLGAYRRASVHVVIWLNCCQLCT